MHPIVTVQAMREIDQKAIDGDVVLGYSYMKRASQALAAEVELLANVLGTREVVIFCGKGNNGGDGYYLGKLLLELNYTVTLYALCETSELQGESSMAFDSFSRVGGETTVLKESSQLADLKKGIIVDALLGTGIKGPPRGMYKKVIEYINSSTDFVFAVDNPSGFDANTGFPSEVCVEADMTVSLGFSKVGHYFGDPHLVGQLRTHALGYPAEIVKAAGSVAEEITISAVKEAFPRRHYYGSKYDHGVVVACCGSKGMTGAPTLAAQSALRTGCGMTYLITPESLIPSLSSNLIEPVMVPVPDTEEGTLSLLAIDRVESLKGKIDVLLVGPGLSRNSETAEAVREMISEATVPVVLDGDGLSAFQYHKDLLKSVDNLLITPHYGEWKRLFGELPEDAMDRLKRLSEVALDYGVHILFKGMPTIIVNPKGKIKFSTFGNSGLATAGSGDVLAGIISSLVAQGISLENATIVGAALHGKAGDIAVKDLNEYSLIASDLIAYLPKAINYFMK